MISFNNQLIQDIPVQQVLSNKNEIAHAELFNNALSKLKLDLNLSDNDYKFIEIKINNEFDKPSNVVVIQKLYPYTKTTYSLSKYWDKYKFNKTYKSIDNTDKKLEVLDKFYINDKILVRNKYDNEEIVISFDEAKNIPYSEDWYKFNADLNIKSSIL